jgi:hypothetical protein
MDRIARLKMFREPSQKNGKKRMDLPGGFLAVLSRAIKGHPSEGIEKCKQEKTSIYRGSPYFTEHHVLDKYDEDQYGST